MNTYHAFRTAQIGHLSDGVIQTFLVYPHYGIFTDSWQEEVIIMKTIVSKVPISLCGNYGILLTHSSFSVIKTHVLAVEGVDWLLTDNGAKHKTSNYELVNQKKACIVRRGDVFSLAIKCKDRGMLDVSHLYHK